jgi:hypothetical protein
MLRDSGRKPASLPVVGSNLSTRNQTDFSATRLLRSNNWFYSGRHSFLQSSVQGIDLQTTLGGGIGRLPRNNSRKNLYLLGGFGWQNAKI